MKNKVLIGISGLLSAAMLVIWFFMLSGVDVPRVWRGFLINYLFFTSVAAGLVVWPAIIIAAYGKWMKPVEYIGRTGISFALPSLVALVVLWSGSQHWAPWIEAPAEKQWWLNNTFLFSRNLVAQFIFWALAVWFMQKRKSSTARVAAGWLVFVYAITFSLAGFDFVMALEPEWYSMMIGGYFFISGLYLAAAVWILLSVGLKQADVDVRHDLGKLLVAFCMVTAYLMYSHLLPIWYENMPEETIFLIPRMNLAWKSISYVLLASVYLGPLLLLLPRSAKRNPIFLTAVAALVVVGMWIERWWLVAAVFEQYTIKFGWSEIVPFLAFLGMMTAGIMISLKRQRNFRKTNN